MKGILLLGICFFSLAGNAQLKDRVEINRESSARMATASVRGGANLLFVGEEHFVDLLVSGREIVEVFCTNGTIELDSTSLRATGPITCKVTPLEAGVVKIKVGCREKGENGSHYVLIVNQYSAVDKRPPMLWINGSFSGEYIGNLPESCEIKAFYTGSYATFQRFEVASWEVTVGSESFKGTKAGLSSEAITAINEAPREEIIKITAYLMSNEDGFTIIKGIYMLE